jgi:hypothetical protein
MDKEEDLKKLAVLLEYEGLNDWEKDAFPNMKEKLEKSGRPLTPAQRAKVDGALERLGLDLEKGSKNLWSSGKVPMGKHVVMAYENMPKPLRPPGRRS